MRFIIRGAQVYLEGTFRRSDIFVSGTSVHCCSHFSPTPEDTVFDFPGSYIFPGFADVHVHLREPGFSYKETIATGTAAASHGGYTDICTMPNLSPYPDCPEGLRVQEEQIARAASVRVHPYGCITVGENGKQLVDFGALAPNVVAFSDDGKGVQDAAMMEKAMREAKKYGKIIAAHCEDNTLLKGGFIHDGAYARAHGYRGICSESEWRQVARDLMLAAKTGCAYHVCHVSTAESVSLIREAKKAGLDVTCETAPHYLTLTENDLQEDGRFKMNPPLREERDRQALLEGISDGTVDMIATDHAPHSAEEKSRGLSGSLMGVVGLETAFSVLYTRLVKTKLLRAEDLARLLHDAPCSRFGIGHPLCDGGQADFTVFDPDVTYEIRPETFATCGRATPFAGDTVCGKHRMTVLGGNILCKESI